MVSFWSLDCFLQDTIKLVTLVYHYLKKITLEGKKLTTGGPLKINAKKFRNAKKAEIPKKAENACQFENSCNKKKQNEWNKKKAHFWELFCFYILCAFFAFLLSRDIQGAYKHHFLTKMFSKNRFFQKMP